MDFWKWHSINNKTFTLDESVHVWLLSLNVTSAAKIVFKNLLSEDERNRANCFHFEKNRTHYIVARGQLRLILGRYLNFKPEKLHFTYNDYGKPALDPEKTKKQIYFNVSHSHELVMIAVNENYELGIDIEWMRPHFAGLNIAKRFFSRNEVNHLREVPKSQQKQAFFNCWTRKEAYIKARGKGLSIPLNQFDVALKPGEPARLLASRHDPEAILHWKMYSLPPVPNYAAALVVNNLNSHILCWKGTEQKLLKDFN